MPRILRRDDRENAFKNGNALFFTVPRQTAELSWLSEVGVPSSVEDIGLSEKKSILVVVRQQAVGFVVETREISELDIPASLKDTSCAVKSL